MKHEAGTPRCSLGVGAGEGRLCGDYASFLGLGLGLRVEGWREPGTLPSFWPVRCWKTLQALSAM